MQGPVIVARPQPHPHLTALRYLAIAQVIIGVLTAILGILARIYLEYWVDIIGTGIWTGGWIILTGTIGITATRNYMNTNCSFTNNMVFNILSTCASGFTGLFFFGAILYYGTYICEWWEHEHKTNFQSIQSNRTETWDCDVDTDTGLGINIPLLLLMVLNFFISIVCAAWCTRCCGQRNTPGQVVIQQPAVFPTGQVISQYAGQMPPPYGTQVQPVYLSQQINYSQYPSQQPNTTQYLTQQANGIQYPPQQINVPHYPPQQLNAAQYPPQEPIAAQQQKDEACPKSPPEYSTES